LSVISTFAEGAHAVPRVHYKEAVEMILKENPAFDVGADCGAPMRPSSAPKFESGVRAPFPSAIKAFYMKEDPRKRATA